MIPIFDFVCWVAVVSLSAAFGLSLVKKWGWLEWLQVNAPNDFLHELFSCKFCCSWWASVIICVPLSVGAGAWILLAVPICSTLIVRELW